MKSTFRRFAFVAATAALTLPLGAADCVSLGGVGGDAGPAPCELSTDCPGTERCHPVDKVCEAECIDDLDCSGDRPRCNVRETAAGSDEPTYILEVEGIRDLCICDDDSCAEGEECSPDTGTCVPSGSVTCDPTNNGDECPDEQPFCSEGVCKAGCDSDDELKLECTGDQFCGDDGACVDLCSPVGDVNDDDEVCGVDGRYEEICDHDVCLDDNQLCEDDSDFDTFNQCDDPDAVLAYCDAADSFPGGRENGGPVVYDVDFERDADLDEDCDSAVAGTDGYTLTFLYWDADGDAYSGNTGSYAAYRWAEDGSAPANATLPLGFAAADGTSGVAVMTVCFASPPDTIAVQIEDQAGNRSNVACAPLLD